MFPGIQALRAVAALMIVSLHVGNEAGFLAGQPHETPFAWMAALPLDAGVDLFFVISGFVMVWAQRRDFGDASRVRPFVWRRVRRVVPLYWLLTVGTFAAGHVFPSSVSSGPAGVGELSHALLFLPYRQPDGLIQPLLRLGWTLNYEMLFYALFAACLPFRHGRILVLGGLGALVAAGQSNSFAAAPLVFWTDPIVLEFGFGVLLGALVVPGRRAPWWAALGITLAIGAVAATRPEAIARVAARGLFAACAVAASLRVPALPRWITLLGDASYALYLVHPFPMRGLRLAAAAMTDDPAMVPIYAVAALGSAIGAALLLHLWVERPLMRLGHARVAQAV